MNRLATTPLLLLFLAASCCAAVAQTNPAPARATNDLTQWIGDSVDDALQFLDDVDAAQTRDFFDKLDRQFDDTNIFEMASMKDVALRLLPVLKQFDETQPYAAWLQAHLDEFDAADKMRQQMKALPPNQPRPSVLKVERSIWIKELQGESWPPLAKTYIPKLKPIFIAEKVPPELVWVAGVESSFDSRARSPAGAAGMFQLMPATARQEHLSLWPFDQRYQPEKSARAAARYLRSLHRHYGDWPLALAAYNVGAGRVDKLLKEHKVNSFDAVSRWLPAETQMYVPKIEATLRAREGVALADLRPPD